MTRKFFLVYTCSLLSENLLKYIKIAYLFYYIFEAADFREKYATLREKYVANRNSTKKKLTEYIEKDAGVKLTEFHDQLKTFCADLSKQHIVSQRKLL